MSCKAIVIQCSSVFRWRTAILIATSAALVITANSQPAYAVITPAVTIDGPSDDIVGFGGVAMAEDGTGGLVYLKRDEGVTHVYVARFIGGHWLAPQRVDTEEKFAASSPQIGAADNGELVVVWATPFATEKGQPVQELLSATLAPGSSTFGQAIIVDPNVGEGLGLSPDLAMSSTGFADVVYRVVSTSSAIPLLRQGDVAESVRVAHFNGERWSRLGEVNRDPGVSMRPPTAANAPQIAIGPTGNGVVVWQEPEITGVARIWARRLFGSTLDYVMPVSAASLSSSPINEDADAPSVAVSRLGQADVAYRQQAGPGSPLPGPRIFINTLPNGESESGTEFLGAHILDSSVPGGRSATVGRPDVDLDEKSELSVLYDDDGQPRVVDGNDKGISGALTLGSPFVASTLGGSGEVSSASVMNPEGGGVSAWPSVNPAHEPAVAAREDFPDGAVQTGLISSSAGGPIVELAVGRSGLGDGLVAFQQGPLGDAAIAASEISATPQTFAINVPKGWIKPAQANVSWAPAPSANGPVTYIVILDGRRLPTSPQRLSFKFDPRGLANGTHDVQVLATDIYGQSTLTPVSKLSIDGSPPVLIIRRTHGDHAVSVRIRDMQSGVDTHAVTVSFGDGVSASGHASFSHRYSRPGTYRIVAHVRDNVGNSGVVTELVSIR
jgi:hypothetical protein